MRKLIDANRTQAALDWSQIDWQKIEKTVLRLQHRIFMAQLCASLEEATFSGHCSRAVCVERRTYGSWGGARREAGPYPLETRMSPAAV